MNRTSTSAPAALTNWMEAPYNVQAFRHVRQILPTARVSADTARPLNRAERPELLELPVGNVVTASASQGANMSLDTYLRSSYGDSLVILHDGKIVLEWYGEGAGPEDRHINFSVTKSVTGLLAGALWSAGLLDFDAPVAQYLPETTGSGYGTATVRQLLDMTASVSFVEDYTMADSTMARYRRAVGWIPGIPEEGMHDVLGSIPSDGPHDTRFRYLSPTTDLLGWVCERACDSSYAEALSRYVWVPMGAESDADITLDPFGAARAAGGLSSTARDLARVGQLVVERGGEAIDKRFVDDLLSGGSRAHWKSGDLADSFDAASYRSCWYCLADDPEVVVGSGIHGQTLYVDARRNVVVAKQSHWPTALDEAGFRDASLVARSIALALSK